ncbi:hypothetical protein DPMN_087330 [Dreissena polymorpha]|uniref:Caspase family p10 domain-containing protein n=1 Tax=Dreissena polymorpha TaxID=45954 RepID=A0A9D4KSH4_DREPO|nr:hypothetical protein DPMN_087330 [Dreissena polymorpha]
MEQRIRTWLKIYLHCCMKQKPSIEDAIEVDVRSVSLMNAEVKRKQNIVDEPLSLDCEIYHLVFYATPTGSIAWRNKAEGSWMIRDLHSLILGRIRIRISTRKDRSTC